jgi:hypothetical protein
MQGDGFHDRIRAMNSDARWKRILRLIGPPVLGMVIGLLVMWLITQQFTLGLAILSSALGAMLVTVFWKSGGLTRF